MVFSNSDEQEWEPVQPIVLVKLCGHLRAARSDRALLVREAINPRAQKSLGITSTIPLAASAA